MRHLALILVVLSCGALTACAVKDSPVVSSNDPHGVIRTDVSREAQNIYAVRVVNIDGREIPSRPGPLMIEPGEHTFIVIGAVNQSNASGLDTTINSNADSDTITINVQQGVTYYVGMAPKEGRPNAWAPKVWKTE